MKFTQEKKGLMTTTVELDLQETGFNFIFTEKKPFARPDTTDMFFSYADLTNQKTYVKTVNPYVKSAFLYTGLVFSGLYYVLIYSIFIEGRPPEVADGSVYFRLLFWLPIIVWYALYHLVAKQKTVIVRGFNSHFTILDNKQTDAILAELYKRRNTYMRKKYIDDKNTRKVLTVETLETLRALGVITGDECAEIKTVNEKENSGVGFVSTEEKDA